ncbi:MAG: hypothetical protein EA358_10570 [Flavobacteriales bacterium]|nr:MAG: hypothetical protein EA358_10570 [Flavobacteriales bacterium]
MEGAPMHHTPSYSSSIYFINVGEHQTQNIYLSPHAWLKLHIENVNPQPGDRITISWGGGVTKTFHGGVNEASVFFGGGNFNRSIPFELYRNGEWIRWRDTVWMNAFDTVYHKVEY